MSTNKVMATLDFGWDTRILAMPLDVAHKIQALLTQAVKYDTEYRKEKQRYASLSVFVPPNVAIMESDIPVVDATCLNRSEYNKWKTAVREGLDADDNATAKDIIPPAVWQSMQGDAE